MRNERNFVDDLGQPLPASEAQPSSRQINSAGQSNALEEPGGEGKKTLRIAVMYGN